MNQLILVLYCDLYCNSQVRQYFVQGWYPTGYQNPSNIYNPSGALIKAMLIHSAIGVTSYDGIEQGDITLGELKNRIVHEYF